MTSHQVRASTVSAGLALLASAESTVTGTIIWYHYLCTMS